MSWVRRLFSARPVERSPQVVEPTEDEVPEHVAGTAPTESDSRPESSAELERFVEVWDAIIEAAHAQLVGVLDEAVHESADLIRSNPGDFGPVTRRWNRAAAAQRKLVEQVSDGWDEISEQLSGADGIDHDRMMLEARKRDAATTELEIAYTHRYRETMAKATHHFLSLAPEGSEQRHLLLAGGAPLFVAELAAHEPWAARQRAEVQVQAFRNKKDVPLSLLQEYGAQNQRYWTLLFETEAQLNPDLQSHAQNKIESRIKDAQRFLAQYWQWRQHRKAMNDTPGQ